ncbi:MAG: Re/Si-specific NAD(P)(+) transhydrogenase subunit alpha [Phycisphaerae bacterium]
MIVGVVKESFPGEQRVALVPSSITALMKSGFEVIIETGAGQAAGYPDSQYHEKGAKVQPTRGQVFAGCDILLQVRTLGANPHAGRADLTLLRGDQILIGLAEPLTATEAIKSLAESGVTLLALELIPRITRAQSMDVLSSQASIAGYKAVLMAADALGKIFPMMMTAAGTIQPAKVLVIGAGVAGLQAIATAKRLGAVVSGYDVRPAVKEQVESLGARFIELPIETAGTETKGGYAKEQTEDQLRKQRELMARVVAESDVAITTAAIPGKKAPVLLTGEMVRRMQPGSVVVDLAAERGGNCELTQPDRTVVDNGVIIIGPANPASLVPYHASQTFSNNLVRFLQHLMGKDQQVRIDTGDEITRETLVCRDGQILHPRVRETMGLTSPSGPERTDG